jgi:hypothetical protein
VLVGAFLAIAAPLFAQDRVIRIVVKDDVGAVLPGAQVSLIDTDGRVVSSRLSDPSGQVTWTDLARGRHRFRVDLPGFESTVLTVVAGGSRVASATAVLTLGVLGETIVIPYTRRRWWLLWLR